MYLSDSKDFSMAPTLITQRTILFRENFGIICGLRYRAQLSVAVLISNPNKYCLYFLEQSGGLDYAL